MKIAIDMDDVLIPFASSVIKYYNRINHTNHKIEEFTDYSWNKITDGTPEGERRLIYNFLDSHEYKKISHLDGADIAIDKLHKNNDLYVVSARPTDMEKLSLETINRLYKDKFKKILLVNDCPISVGLKRTKAEVCSKLETTILIEDSIRHAIGVASVGINVLLFDKPWNQEIIHQNITRVYSWSDALSEIKNLSPKV